MTCLEFVCVFTRHKYSQYIKKMKKIQVLGLSKDYISVIAEILSDCGIATHVDIFLNIELDIIPVCPVKEFSFSIMPLGDLPDKDKPALFGVPGPRNKSAVFDSFVKTPGVAKARYINVIHPTAYLAGSSTLEQGILLEPGVIVSSQSYIGFGATIKRGSLIGHHNVIGDFTDINPGVVLSGNVKVGRGCILGSGVVVKDNISIGENTFIGAGSVVTKDMPSNCIAYGNPCKFIKENDLWII